MPVVRKVHRSFTVGSVTIRIVEGDITSATTEVIVNAANMLSFTPMDCGVSGALRNACKPDNVTGKEKRWWNDEGTEHNTKKVPTTYVGLQEAAGGLKENGVKFIGHAVGPIWSDYPLNDKVFKVVMPKIKVTIRRALDLTKRVGASSCTLPAVSGGIFTHWSLTSDIKSREQRAARYAACQAVFTWATKNQNTSVTDIELIDLSRRQKGCIHFFADAFDASVTQYNEENEETLPTSKDEKDTSSLTT